MGLMKKLTSAVVASSLVLGLVGTAAADFSPAGVNEAAARMQALGVVKGTVLPNGQVDLALNEKITRAQLVTILVRAFGKEADSQLLKGAPVFTDTSAHWASGEIAMAKAIIESKGHKLGVTETTFAPDKDVTSAEAIALVMKFLGVKADTTKTWPMDYIQGAVNAGLISEADKTALTVAPNSPAVRGLVFYLADHAFSTYTMPETKATVYGSYLDTKAPVITVDATFETTTSEDQVTLSGTVTDNKKVAVLHVGSIDNAVAVDANGKWSTTVKLAAGENKVWIHALDIAGNAGVYEGVNITRVAGDAAKIEAKLGSALLKAGESTDVTIKVTDAKGTVVTGAAKVDVQGEIGSYDEATGKFTAATTPAEGKLVITAGNAPAVELNVMVKAGAVAKLVISPATVDLQTSGTQKFTAAGEDEFGNAVEIGNVTWTSSKGIIGNDGTFGATADSTGSVTITAKSGEFTATATATVYGNATKVQLAAPEAMIANGESTTTVTATVLDANGNVAKNYNGTVTFASSNTSAVKVKTATVQAVNGVATTTLESGTSATATVLSASASGLTGTTVTFTPAAQVATSISVTGPASLSAVSGSEGTVKLTVLDQAGVKMAAAPSGSNQLKVKLTSSDKSIAFFGTDSDNTEVTMDAAEKTAVVKATAKVGAATINAAVTSPTGSAVTVNSISVNTMVVGAAYQITVDEITGIKAGENFNVVFRVKDFNGNQLTNLTENDAYTLKVYSGTTEILSVANLDLVLGTGKNAGATISVDPSGFGSSKADKVGTYTVKVSKSGLVTGEGSVAIAPAAASRLSLSATPDTIAANGAAQATLKVTISDNFGNKVTDGSYAVTLKKTTSNSATGTFADTVVNTNNGEATVTVTSTTLEHGTGDGFTATATGLTASTQVFVKTAIFGAAYQLDMVNDTNAAATAYTATAGSDATVYVAVKDANSTPRIISNDQGRLVTLTVKDGSTVVGTFTGTTVNGVAAITLNLQKAKNGTSAYTLEATADSLQKDTIAAGAATGLKVNPASATAYVVSADRTDLAADGASDATITVKLADAYGNSVPAADGDIVYVKASTTSYGDLGSKESSGDWTGWTKLTAAGGTGKFVTVDNTSSFQANSSAGSVTITAKGTSSSIAEGTLVLNTKVAGSKASFTVDSVTDTAASTDKTVAAQKVVVRVTDGNGTLLTNDSSAVNLAAVMSGKTGTVHVYGDSNGAPGTELTAQDNSTAADTTDDYFTVNASKGVATFWVIDDKADSLTYTLSVAAVSGTKTAGAKFVPGTATQVIVGAANPGRIMGDGVAMTTLKARVADALGNTVTTATGTVNFSLAKGNDYATLLQTSAPVVNGEAVIALQAKAIPAGLNATDIDVKAEYDLNADGSVASSEAWTGNDVVSVDSTTPSVSSFAATATSIELTFSEALDVTSIASSGLNGFSVSGAGSLTSVALKNSTNNVLVLTGTGFTTSTKVQYSSAAGGNIADVAGNKLPTVTDYAITTVN